VLIKTSQGEITIELDQLQAPISVKNFLDYADAKHYDGTIFHRVIPGFMIQGGGFNVDFVQKKTRGPVPNEASNGLRNEVGTIAMARTSEPNSATAQFFINVNDNQALNFSPGRPGYAVFGKVVKGMDVVTKIVAVETGPGPVPPHQNVPRKPVVIEDAKIVVPADKAGK
jgi:cyclophilin family peptidyl-prolyl cis-trans isomerase